MIRSFLKTAAVAVAITTSTAVSAAQFVVELAEPLRAEDTASMQSGNVSEVERFEAADKSYIVVDAKDEVDLASFLMPGTSNP